MRSPNIDQKEVRDNVAKYVWSNQDSHLTTYDQLLEIAHPTATRTDSVVFRAAQCAEFPEQIQEVKRQEVWTVAGYGEFDIAAEIGLNLQRVNFLDVKSAEPAWESTPASAQVTAYFSLYRANYDITNSQFLCGDRQIWTLQRQISNSLRYAPNSHMCRSCSSCSVHANWLSMMILLQFMSWNLRRNISGQFQCGSL